ncbi:MAG: hypothetical protein IPG61_10295 [bacterium]|nr:hypothetical protein [bacterium]
MAMGDGVAVPVVHYLAINLLDKLAGAPTIADVGKDRSRREAQGHQSGDGHFLKKVDRHIEAWRATKKRSQER